MRVRGRPNLIVNAGLAVLIAAGGVWGYLSIRGGGTANAASNSSTSVSRNVTVSRGAVTETVTASGSVASASTTSANFVTAGTVTEVDVKVGDTVTKGQVLGRIDCSAANDTLATANANLTAAKANLTRIEDASGSDAASIASAKAQVTNAQGTVDTDQRAVNGCVLTAPMAGTVTAVSGSVGSSSSGTGSSSGGGGGGNNSSSSSSSSSSGFVTIADLTSLQASAGFAEADATKLKVGQVAQITWSALSSATATGKVTSIAPTATTSNSVNTYAVTVSVDKVPDGARLGQTISVKVTVASAENALRVPLAAVTSAGNRYSVKVRKDNVDTVTIVQVGIKGDEYYEITSGLNEGDVVVVTTTVSTGTTGTNNFPGFGGLGGGGFGGGAGRGAGAGAGAGKGNGG
jgi:membrane fusion protein, macrolide-specific efflux system